MGFRVCHSRSWGWLVVFLIVIAGGSAIGDEETGGDLAAYDALIKPDDRAHWSYLPVTNPVVPKVAQPDWVRNLIDAFILARLEGKGWKPAAAAKPRALLRRVFLDVVGLPPTPAEQQKFLNDPSPTAFARVIDDLLQRKGYGERWSRHWLDVVRYAETNGYERDAIKPSVWRYRDYVIDAFNDDKPYNRFVLEQLAGDELADADSATMIATGFYRLGPWDDEPADPLQDRSDQLDDMIRTTSEVFLGMTLGCARCHDHKFDALTMHDYYRMAAIFNGLQRPRNGRTELDLPAGTRKKIAAFEEESEGKKPSLTGLPRGYFLHEPTPNISDSHLLLRGRASTPGPKVQPGFPTVLQTEQPKFPRPDEFTSRRRLTLARWVARPENPLTARVIVNRVWQHHFGQALVGTPNDFGILGDPPTHPELLDWLAHWFVHEADWSLKKLHRLILTSNAYGMSKSWNPDYGREDPTNLFFWRFPYTRLEVEAIRDSMLAVSGRLNRKMHGPSTYLYVPSDALKGHSDPGKIWKPFDENEASRRTIYAFIKRSMVVPMLEVLDLCDTTRSSERRNVTSVPTQALTLFNGNFVNRQAGHLADRLERDAPNNLAKQIDRAWILALCRPPTADESKLMQQFLSDEAAAMLDEAKKKDENLSDADVQHRALVQMCRVIFNLNEFVYPN